MLFGLWPILLSYTITLGDYTPEQLAEPIAFVVLVNTGLWVLLWRLYKDAARAAVFVSILSQANVFHLPLSEMLSGFAKMGSLVLDDQIVLAI